MVLLTCTHFLVLSEYQAKLCQSLPLDLGLIQENMNRLAFFSQHAILKSRALGTAHWQNPMQNIQVFIGTSPAILQQGN